ncbi:hypothetical protein, partial [Roseibium sp. RKSG952]|uniref:hypothetical protein n=1 Tax=Roseibium sp. RKSG952 TaxID=2529384 RepID=UPI001AD8E8E2
MSRETMMDRFVGEMYAATDYGESRFHPMDRRCVKRAARIMGFTSYTDSAEFLNRLLTSSPPLMAGILAKRKPS